MPDACFYRMPVSPFKLKEKGVSLINSIFRTEIQGNLALLQWLCGWFWFAPRFRNGTKASALRGKNQKDSGGFVMTHEIVEQNVIQKYIMHVTT